MTDEEPDIPPPIGPNDEYEWCGECEDHHAWECLECNNPTGQYGKCCHCGMGVYE